MTNKLIDKCGGQIPKLVNRNDREGLCLLYPTDKLIPQDWAGPVEMNVAYHGIEN